MKNLAINIFGKNPLHRTLVMTLMRLTIKMNHHFSFPPDTDQHWTINCQQGVWDINKENQWTDSLDRKYPGASKCVNWYGWTNFKTEGSISTVMKGSGRAKLDFGNCWDGRKPWSHSYVKVYLDGTEIKSASHGQSNVLVEFEFHEGSKLEIKEINVGIIQFNKFEIVPKGKNHLHYLW